MKTEMVKAKAIELIWYLLRMRSDKTARKIIKAGTCFKENKKGVQEENEWDKFEKYVKTIEEMRALARDRKKRVWNTNFSCSCKGKNREKGGITTSRSCSCC